MVEGFGGCTGDGGGAESPVREEVRFVGLVGQDALFAAGYVVGEVVGEWGASEGCHCVLRRRRGRGIGDGLFVQRKQLGLLIVASDFLLDVANRL